MDNTPYMIGQVFGATLLTGTFIFFIVKGFINPKANWLYIYTAVFIALALLFYICNPVPLYDIPLFNGVNALLFLCGIAGCVKYYWQLWKRKKQLQS